MLESSRAVVLTAKFGFINVALEFMIPIYDEIVRKGEIPGSSRILVFVLEV